MLLLRIPKIRSEYFFGMFLVLFWGRDIIFKYAEAFLARIPYIKYVSEYIFPVLMAGCILLCFSYFFKAISFKDIAFWLIVTCVYLLQFMIYPQNNESLIENAYVFLITVLPLYFIGLRFDAEKHSKILHITSIANIWAFVFYTTFVSGAMDTLQMIHSGSMHRAYLLLPQLLVLFGYLFKKPTILNVITATVGFVFLLMCGNRGSVLILMIFIALYMVLLVKKKRRVGVYVGFAAVCAVIAYYFDVIITFLHMFFLKLGMSTRVIETLISGDFFESNGRDMIIQKLMQSISEKPMFGYGIAADRTLSGSYAHNFAVELWVSFGIFIGSFILLLVVYVIVKAWLKSKGTEDKLFLLIMISLGFVKLFISSSYLMEGMLFMLLGVAVGRIRSSQTFTLIDNQSQETL